VLNFSPNILIEPRDVLLDKRPLAPRRFVDHPIDRRQARREIASGTGSECSQHFRLRHWPVQAINPGLRHDRVIGNVFDYKVGRWLAKLFALHVY
jgi:hypothetical protein